MQPTDFSQFVRSYSGTLYTLKDQNYSPSSTGGYEGRYNGLGTGSVYLAESPSTCAAEVPKADMTYRLWQLQASPARVVDLVAAQHAGRDLGPLMEPSGSGGWFPTRLISDWAHQAGYDGVRYPSSKDGAPCLVLYKDNFNVSDADFREISR
jgi:RES domain-containing protein